VELFFLSYWRRRTDDLTPCGPSPDLLSLPIGRQRLADGAARLQPADSFVVQISASSANCYYYSPITTRLLAFFFIDQSISKYPIQKSTYQGKMIMRTQEKTWPLPV
jgi:hypothetical protein